MAKEYKISIVNGSGTENILNGEYSVSATSTGYDSSTIDPKSLTITDDKTTYDLLISANGTLILHVSETGESTGTSVVGAKFYRCDQTGAITYGDAITSTSDGKAIFEHVPFDSTTPPTIYYKQTESDGNHNFSTEVRSITLPTETLTVEITNAPATLKTINLKDANYDGLSIGSAEVTLTEN